MSVTVDRTHLLGWNETALTDGGSRFLSGSGLLEHDDFAER